MLANRLVAWSYNPSAVGGFPWTRATSGQQASSSRTVAAAVAAAVKGGRNEIARTGWNPEGDHGRSPGLLQSGRGLPLLPTPSIGPSAPRSVRASSGSSVVAGEPALPPHDATHCLITAQLPRRPAMAFGSVLNCTVLVC